MGVGVGWIGFSVDKGLIIDIKMCKIEIIRCFDNGYTVDESCAIALSSTSWHKIPVRIVPVKLSSASRVGFYLRFI